MTRFPKTSPFVFVALLTVGLAGCGGADPAPEIAEQGGDLVECALDGANDFAKECRLIAPAAGSAAKWRIVHPDGGFRLLEKGESGYATADGATQADVVEDSGTVLVTIETDRYRLPG